MGARTASEAGFVTLKTVKRYKLLRYDDFIWYFMDENGVTENLAADKWKAMRDNRELYEHPNHYLYAKVYIRTDTYMDETRVTYADLE